jgi:replicative DNA helicase
MDFMSINNIGIEGAEHISKTYEKSVKIITDNKTGISTGYKLGWDNLNKILGGRLQFGTVLTIGARPSVGKSAIANLIAFDIFKLNPDTPTILLYWTWEMSAWHHIHRQISARLNKSYNELQSAETPVSENTYRTILDLKDKLSDQNIFFLEGAKTANAIWADICKVSQNNPEYKIVNIFDHSRLSRKDANEKTEEEKIFNLMLKCNDLSKSRQVTSIILTQLNRDFERGNTNNAKTYRTPQNSDIFGADAVGQFSHVIALVHRPELAKIDKIKLPDDRGKDMDYDTEKLLLIEITKNRNGKIGTLMFTHDLEHYKIHEKKPEAFDYSTITNFN